MHMPKAPPNPAMAKAKDTRIRDVNSSAPRVLRSAFTKSFQRSHEMAASWARRCGGRPRSFMPFTRSPQPRKLLIYVLLPADGAQENLLQRQLFAGSPILARAIA